MKIRLILAMTVAALLSGCGSMHCGGSATNGAEAGDCGLNTTFFGARAAENPAPAYTKS